MIRVRHVQAIGNFRLALEFTNGERGVVDLEPHLWGPVFEPTRHDPALFAAVVVDPVAQTVTWPNGADVDPGVLYTWTTGASLPAELPVRPRETVA